MKQMTAIPQVMPAASDTQLAIPTIKSKMTITILK
jgi:hypothetical protein